MPIKHEIDVQCLWAKYEDIAMHFNDLLMRLRSQSLAGIAAVSVLVGVFSKEGIADIQLDWTVAEAIFVALAAFWIAILSLDLLYYNRLLIGAVKALRGLEEQTLPGRTFDGHINMSTLIEAEFSASSKGGTSRFGGVIAFYVLVFAVIIAGVLWTDHMRTGPQNPTMQVSHQSRIT
jgi:hypothetical protein